MQKISAFVLAYNEAEKIKAAVETMFARRLSIEWRRPGSLKRAAEFDRHRFNSIKRKVLRHSILSERGIVLPLSVPISCSGRRERH